MTHPATPNRSFPRGLAGREQPGLKRSARKGVLRIRVTNDAGHWTVGPEGEIDLSNADALEQAIRRAEASAAETITIDLRRVSFIDLSGVRAIVSAYGRRRNGLRLLEGPAPVQYVFRLTGTEAGLPFER